MDLPLDLSLTYNTLEPGSNQAQTMDASRISHTPPGPLQAQASYPTQSPNFFANTTGVQIAGGEFFAVAGDVHHHHTDPGRTGVSLPLNIMDDTFSESEIYCNQLLCRKRGFPLYVPGPPPDLPAEYQRSGVEIGDVGTITPEGIFDFFFNIYLPANHPINSNDVPESFFPLPGYASKEVTNLPRDPGNHVSTSSVQRLDVDPELDEFPGGHFVFRCDVPQGAVLVLPHGAHLKKLKNVETLRTYAATHAESWYRHIKGREGRGREIANGSLYLVTGWEKAHSWGMASFHSVGDEFHVTFKPTARANSSCQYRWRGNAATKKSYDPSPIHGGLLNQTTFIHGLSISLGTTIWGRLFGTVEIREIAESRLGNIFHPGELINNYILHKAPQASVVLSHDDDWGDILSDDDPESQIQTVSEFLEQINAQYKITEKDGATFLQSMSAPGNEITSTGQHLITTPDVWEQGHDVISEEMLHHELDYKLCLGVVRNDLAQPLASTTHRTFKAWSSWIPEVPDMTFQEQGDSKDITKIIELHRKALALHTPPHPYWHSSVNNLAHAMERRFEQEGDPEDINEAIALHRAFCAPPHPDHGSSLTDLGNAVHTRFKQQGDPKDINETIELHREALALHAPPHPARGESLSNLAKAIKTRFDQQGDLKDIDQTIELHREALALHALSYPNRSSNLKNLAAALQARFVQQNDSRDLDEAIRLHKEALTLHAPPHSELGPSLMALGVCLVTMYKHRHDSLDLDNACTIFQEAVACLSSSPFIRFCHANYWAFTAAQYMHTSSLAAYRAGIELLPQLAGLHLDLSSRQQILSAVSATTLASDAAACAVNLGKYNIAVEFLEASRSVFWSQALRLRTSLDGLATIHPDLAHRLTEASRQLEQASFRDTCRNALADDQQKIISNESEGAYCRELKDNWEQVIQSVRRLYGFEHFMQPKGIAALRQAAISGPIIILTTTDSTCFALTVTLTHDVQCLKLPEMTLPHVDLLAKGFEGAFDAHTSGTTRLFGKPERSGNPNPDDVIRWLLADLWKNIVKPVFAALRLQRSVDPQRLWWCPTGPFAFLPLHAAGIYDTATSECTSDYVISSYTPNLTALLDPPAQIAVPFKVTAVIQDCAPNCTPLPGSRAELSKIMTRVPTQWLTALLDTTVETALVHLRKSSIVHFACHGIQDLKQPLDSGLILADSRLKVSDIMHRLERDKRFSSLAFLNASETAKGDDTVPDESMHLAATFLFAGFRGVVATMWTMGDDDAAKIAETFYEHLFRNCDPYCEPPILPDLTEAAKALHLAIAKLREDPNIPPSRWMPLVHYGL